MKAWEFKTETKLTKEWINSNLIKNNGFINGNLLKALPEKKFKDLLGKTRNEKIYLILNDIKEIPKCEICGKDKIFLNLNIGYGCSCGNKECSKEISKRKIKQNNLKKYGVDSYLKTTEFKEKSKKTLIEKYGVDNPAKSKEIKEKIKKTNLKRYGAISPLYSKEIKEKIKKTLLEKYGVDNISKNKESKEKKKQTLKNHSESFKREILNKRKLSMMEKYGVEFALQNKNIKNSMIQTMIDRYGVTNSMYSKISKEKLNRKNKEKRYEIFKKQLIQKNISLLDSKEDFIKNSNHNFKCLACNRIFVSNKTNIQNVSCFCKKNISNAEVLIYNWLKSLNFNCILSDRNQISPSELDIYLPDYNIAIEFDGLYWHSEPYKDKFYHLNKTNLCKERGIQLIHIFENEWDNKQDIVKSIILAKLGKFERRIMARKCEMRELTNDEYKIFVELNHIQGYAPAKYKIGLFYNGELVQICSFGKSRFKKGEVELIRHCSKLNTQIIGGLSKLLSFYKFDNLITYVDLRYGNGNGYKNWELIEQTKPNYWYWKYFSNEGYVLESRMKYQKHKLKDLLENFDPNLSEWENMINVGFTRIWDCGNLKLKYIKK